MEQFSHSKITILTEFYNIITINLSQVPFEPQRLFMNIKTGRVYHPAPEKAGEIGLVRSNLAIEFSASFNFENGEGNAPTHFMWRDKRYQLDTKWYRDKLS